MNTKLLLLILIVAGFSSCSTAYKAGQTPDDVYYSPVRPQNDYVRVENDEDKNVYHDNNVYRDNNTYEDRNIRVGTRNRRWRRYNDYDYNYPYGNQYPPVYIDPKTGQTSPATTKAPRKTNLGAYKKAADNTPPPADVVLKGGNVVTPTNTTTPARTFPTQTNKSGTGVGNFIRQVFSGTGQSSTNNQTNNNSDNNSATRTFGGNNNNSNNTNNNNSNSNSNSGSSNSSSGKSSSSAPVRTFDKN